MAFIASTGRRGEASLIFVRRPAPTAPRLCRHPSPRLRLEPASTKESGKSTTGALGPCSRSAKTYLRSRDWCALPCTFLHLPESAPRMCTILRPACAHHVLQQIRTFPQRLRGVLPYERVSPNSAFKPAREGVGDNKIPLARGAAQSRRLWSVGTSSAQLLKLG